MSQPRPFAVSRFNSFRQSRKENRKIVRQLRYSVATEHSRGRFFGEARPVPRTTYFPASSTSVAVVICLYNEVGPEISRTIDSLTSSGVALDIVVVADGLAKLSESAQRYLKRLIGLEEAVLRPDSHVWGATDQTFISQPVSLGSSGSTVAVLLKRFNQKKINTHEWFFRAHCPNSGCTYALTTDTGAVFRSGSILRMVRFLDRNAGVAAVTGRQRVMSEFNQRVRNRAAHGEPIERDTLFESGMRLLQGFDFEIDHTGALSWEPTTSSA